MFNNLIKDKFVDLQDKESVRNALMFTFRSTEPFEEELNKDIAEFTKEEIMNYFKDSRTGNINTLRSRLPYLRKYARFYNSETGINNKVWEDIIPTDIIGALEESPEKIRLDEPLTRSFIIGFADRLRNPRDRAVLLGLYEGIKGKGYKEFNDIRPEDVKENCIYIKDRDCYLNVSAKLISYFHQAMESTTYYVDNTRFREYPLIFSTQVALKHLNTIRKPNPRPFASVIIRLAEEFNAEDYLTATNIRAWGMADFMLQKMRKHKLNLDQTFDAFFDDVKDQFGIHAINKLELYKRAERLYNYEMENN